MNNGFANRMKELRKNKGYTQKKLASLLNIGQTTVANYEQGTRVPDMEKLNKMADLFEVTLDYLLGRSEEIARSTKDAKSKGIDLKTADKVYLNYLLQGDSENARKLIVGFHEDGVNIEYIFFDILDKVLKEVGVLWEKGTVDVWKEHFISEVTIDVMREIKFREKRKSIKSKSMISLNAGAELHNIGLRMISDILEVEGWNVIYLGCNVPVQSVVKAIDIEKPKFIAISITLEYHIDSAIYMISAIKKYFGKNSPIIILGGSAFSNYEKVCEKTGADYYARDIDDIRDILKKNKL
ncbi:cobalamin-dependent protein [Clostridium sp. C8]|uniref:cobalamin-dependent protein n=1 Tax=Clostridium sp. C8 TaxID=1667357 RepID=UPI00062E7267|nr:cobalamin-dependent protein [Clostridium sp. C8]KLE14786.1 XRE family transcriptional regulator [Clostridium sp. C8]